MYISRVSIKGFRRLREAELTFRPGLNVIVGENNSGKTSIVDALLALLDKYRFDRDDFYLVAGNRADELSIEGQFTELNVTDEAAFIEALVRGPEAGKYDAKLAVSATVTEEEVDRTFDLGEGGKAGLYYQLAKNWRVDYLQPLRDPGGIHGLKPGKLSRQAELLRKTTTAEEKDALKEEALKANKSLKETEPITRATGYVKANLESIMGLVYAQNPDLRFLEPEFSRLVSQVEVFADDYPIDMTGLGFGNIYYIAAVLGELKHAKDSKKRYRALIIEEPEAHLHPQYQILLLRFLQRQLEDRERQVQVFVTTHSPIFASQVALDSLLPVTHRTRTVKVDGENKEESYTTVGPVDIKPGSNEARIIRQYLDATRSELFFAKSVILVEGDAERLLLPTLARIYKEYDLEVFGTSVVSLAGLNFASFIPFIGEKAANIPVAIVTDGDQKLHDEEPDVSSYVKKLERLADDEPNIEVFHSNVTFEYAIAELPDNADIVMEAMNRVRRNKGPAFQRGHGSLRGPEFAEKFMEEFFGEGSTTSKPAFAMELAVLLQDKSKKIVVPEYLRDAFDHVCVKPEGTV